MKKRVSGHPRARQPRRLPSWAHLGYSDTVQQRSSPFLIALSLLLVPLTGRAQEEQTAERAHGGSPRPVFELLTVGPGDDLFALWGHSSLCHHTGVLEEGRCYDFGMSTERDPLRLAVGTLQGEALFLPISFPAQVLLKHYAFREMHRQVLPLKPEQSYRLWRALEERVRTRRPYAYQPVFNNCSTQLRDFIDTATGGKLHERPDERTGTSLRTLAEAGLSGQALPLLLTELGAGATIDGASTQWERMAFPDGLMLGVADGLGAPATLVHPAATNRPPTSPHAGRLALLLLSLGLTFGALRARSARHRVWAASIGGVLGSLGLLPIVGQLSTLPSLHSNWLLGVACVSDLAIIGLRGQALSLYLTARLGLIGLLTLASLSGWITQPLLVPALCVALPLASIRYRTRRAN